jgi:cytochrome c553
MGCHGDEGMQPQQNVYPRHAGDELTFPQSMLTAEK